MFFKKNIAALKKRNPDLAEVIEATKKGEDLQVVQAKSGKPSLRAGDIILHSVYDPVREAQTWIEHHREKLDRNSSFVVLGFAMGYHLVTLLQYLQSQYQNEFSVYVFEPRADILKTAFEHVDLSFALPSIHFISEHEIPRLENKFVILEHKPSINANPAFFKQIRPRLAVYRSINKGLKIMVIGPIYGGSLPIARYCVSALKNLGHKVDFVDCSIYKDAFLGISAITKNKAHQGQLQEKFVEFASEAVVARCGEFKPDLVFALAQAPLTASSLEKLRAYRIPTAFWFVEDYRHMEYWKKMAPFYDFFFTIQKDAFHNELEKAGVKNYHYLPLAASTSVHKKIDLTENELKIYGSDISFVGAGYFNRRSFFEGLLDFDFKIWGNEWDFNSPVGKCIQRSGKRIDPGEIVKIFNATRININLHSSSYHKGVNPYGDFVNPRTFEIAACEAFQLVDYRSELPGFFKIDEEIACYKSLEDLRKKIKFYLENPDDRKQIARKGRARIEKEHTYEHRMREMMDFLFERGYEPPAWHSDRRDVKELVEAAGKETELGKFFSRFNDKEEIGLGDIVQYIRENDGPLSDVETVFLFMNALREHYGNPDEGS